MGTAERRTQIMLILCRRRHDTVLNLAKELGVSTRTILRDIEVLSITEPIYTQCGRYGGGIYVTAEYTMTRMYMTEKELAVLHKLSKLADEKAICELSTDESVLLKSIISQYTKQKS
ncbi:MAG: HTH domain-containing protein [Ruminococcaceae bacterium]|nr:HTH domain-containing protein [Oscillospiraceae bacterium]